MDFQNKKVLVVGGSGVLGSIFCQQLALHGAKVIATATSAGSLSNIPDQVNQKQILDLEDSESIKNFVSALNSDGEKLSGVILASGVVGFSTAEHTTSLDLEKITTINYLGPVQIINGLFESLKPEPDDESFILGISGVVVEQTFPGMSAYSSSKSALSSYLQTITKEWRKYKIKVTEARLGHTETGLATRAIFGSAPQMPTGLNPEEVVKIMLNAIIDKKPLLNSVDFN